MKHDTSPSALPYGPFLGGLGVLAVLVFGASLLIGPVSISPLEGWQALGGDDTNLLTLVLQEIRFPRAILGAAVGAILGLSGAVLQGLLRNPLADPGLLGISASASLGAVIALYSGLAALHIFALPVAALTTATLAVSLIILLVGRSFDILTIILAGVALTSLAGALTSLALNLSSDPFAALEIVFWMMGSLTDRSMDHVFLSLPFIMAGGVLLFATARALDALSLGHDVATSLGINLKRTRTLAIFGTAIGVGAATAVSGAIGFVGLVVPHVLRPLVGNRPSHLLPASALGGAIFLMTTDILVRVILPGKDLKLGVMTAMVGAPFFLWLLYSLKRRAV
ncbi:FecCD family ABC transporter permease [Sneathiella chinensis]|uniref:ABC transporter permease n=1 Tax=Sneathiella chinensis TaxID=349750 RepID=A0ABQ5U6M4_9PROT|nr:iron ABC transporter permease [Sneathiella chinensis]GLQ06873.1 ABC transporter permease [Sneathiella chinensis]